MVRMLGEWSLTQNNHIQTLRSPAESKRTAGEGEASIINAS